MASARVRPTVTFPVYAATELIQLGHSRTCVNNLPRIALDSAAAGIWIYYLLQSQVQYPNHSAV